MEKSRAKIKSGGHGGFLNPPTHPEHDYHVESTKKDDFSISLSSAVETDWIIDSVREKAKEMLDAWVRPDIDSDEVQDWIHQVLGYFENCYSPDGINRNAGNCKITHGNPFEIGIMRHLGVLFILQYYPEYEPKGLDFMNAYWGKKSNQVIEKPQEEMFYEQGSKWKKEDNVHVIANTTTMMVIYYDEKDERPNPKLYKDTKLAFSLTHKKIV